MALKITSKQTTIKLGPHKGEEMYVMKMDYYNTIDAEKIIQYAADTSNIPKGVMRASCQGDGVNHWLLEVQKEPRF